MVFEWDDGNIKKILRRYQLKEVEEFFDQEIFVITDPTHSKVELRFIAVGLSSKGKPMFVCFTLRNSKIRVISARFMRTKEALRYESFKESKKE